MTGKKLRPRRLPLAWLLAASLLLPVVPLEAGGRKLERYEKCLLGVFYPDRTLEEASIVNGHPSQVGHDPVMTVIVQVALARKYGVTIGREMFFPSGRLDTRSKSGMVWLSHEMKHVAQAEAFGKSQDFLQGYTTTIRDNMLSGDGSDAAYMNSPFETDARAVEEAYRTLLARRGELGDALSGREPDKEVCSLVERYPSEYKSVLIGVLKSKERETRKFIIPSYPFLLPKKVTYTFFK